MDAIEVIKTRRSIRAFSEHAVPRDVLADIVDCGRLAPTAMNRQQWEFVVVTRREALQELGKIIFHAPWLANANAAIIVLGDPANEWWIEDASAATQNILLAARAHGLGSCWLVGERMNYVEQIGRLIKAPANLRVLSIVALGYPAESPTCDKRNLDSVLHWETF